MLSTRLQNTPTSYTDPAVQSVAKWRNIRNVTKAMITPHLSGFIFIHNDQFWVRRLKYLTSGE